jgi:hypothetical protein
MNTTIDFELHNRHCEALARQLIQETVGALDQVGIRESEKKREVLGAILFRVCAVLDGSAHGGSMDGQPIAPFVGFYLGRDIDRLLVPEDGSAMHEYINDLLDEHFGGPAYRAV